MFWLNIWRPELATESAGLAKKKTVSLKHVLVEKYEKRFNTSNWRNCKQYICPLPVKRFSRIRLESKYFQSLDTIATKTSV